MTSVEITLQLPEDLVRDAQEFNLLTGEMMASLLQSEVDRRVMDMVNVEIQAYRAEKAAHQNPKPQSSQ